MKKLFFVFLVSLFTISVWAQDSQKAKYVFLFIGDGMGLAHINATEAYKAAMNDKIGVEKLNFTKFPNVAVATTYAKDRYITDSAAAGTALATGNKTAVETISMDYTRTKKFKSIATMAKEKNMKVGIITTVNMNDATPSVFYANQPVRSMSKEIAQELLTSNFDFFGGGGLRGIKDLSAFLSKGPYKFVDTKKGFRKVSNKDGKVYIACPIRDEAEACRYSVDQNSDDITLSDITKKAIEVLDNPNGFFMMVEGGKIDWAAHANDAASVIKDVEAFDKSIVEAINFYNKHPKETTIIVTADHETGGFALGYSGMEYDSAFTKLKNQKISVKKMDEKIEEYKQTHKPENAKLDDLMPFISKNFGLGVKSKGLELTQEEIQVLQDAFTASMTGKKHKSKYGKDSDPLSSTVSRILDQKAGIAWTTFSHTGIPVMVFAKGQGSEMFKSYIDNTDIPKNIMKIADLK